MYFLIDVLRETISVFVRIAPYLLFGFFVAGALKVLIPTRWLSEALGKRDFRSVLLASLAGVPLPLCSCSVLPTAVALRENGASRGATVSFLVSTPETGVDSISVTYALMDPVMTVSRPLAAFASAMAAGAAVNLTERDVRKPPPERPPEELAAEARAVESQARPSAEDCAPEEGASCECEPAAAIRGPEEGGVLRRIVAYGYGEVLTGIAPWLLIGIFLTGLITAVIPDGALANPALRGLPSMLAMLVIGIPLYVCDISSTPIAAALILKGLSPGAALVFLLAGPATNVASVTILWKLLGRRTVLVYLASIAVMSLVAGGLINAIYAASGIDASAVAGQAGAIFPEWLEWPAAVVLLALLVRSARQIGMLSNWRRSLGRFGSRFGIDLGGRAALRTYAIIVLILYLLTGVGTIGPGEVGWVVSFGKVVRSIDRAGLVVHAPYPFAFLEREKPDLVRMIDRGYRISEEGAFTYERAVAGASDRELTKEAEVAVGDENLLAIRYSVQYQVADPYAYHYGISNPDDLVAGTAEYALRRVMCEQLTDSVLVNHRIELEAAVADRLQSELDGMGVGISVLRIDLVDVHAPPEVHFAFRDVASAMEDKHRFTHQAESYRARKVAAARGASYTNIQTAAGDSLRSVARSHGETYGFTALAEASRPHREITRLRMYLDAAGELLPKSRLILPLVDLPLDLWVQQRGAAERWPEPLQMGSGSGGATGSPAGSATGRQTPADVSSTESTLSEETWREKLQRLQESER
ncbi:MAG: SO_0444 family Cu/Zn efflux transporter [Candidatus Eisenbacteria bacterium]|nr:SO_0444 family Cu/Zn efflux transporter [Candidatus Eisenbacteria bacterium]